ncbi:MAG: nucleotidyl transferase AbiEii/AbiGii toxin family protein [Desulfobacterales bacterium]|nr:nucleotidyl transferase AbiEii/AbiGii toxin family protein [Desulfobacterales bacterium]
MDASQKPNLSLAKKSLPTALFTAIKHIFSQNVKDCILVGGTALSGFYAAHRRSDDIDLFVKSAEAFKAVVLAVNSLKNTGVNIKKIIHSSQYFKAVCSTKKHSFTVDIVLDENIFSVGNFHLCRGNIAVVDLKTLLMMKSAALLSRCSEKDLYDLIWLFQNLEGFSITDLIENGKKIDTGLNPETMLYSISSSTLSKESCNFSLDSEIDTKQVYKMICKFKDRLVSELENYLSNNTSSDLKAVVDKIKRLS